MTDQATNTYKYSMINARTSADYRAAEIRSALNAASLALMAGAWESTRADKFGQALSDHRSTLQSVAGEERETLDAKISTEPDQVPKGSWEANFSRFASKDLR